MTTQIARCHVDVAVLTDGTWVYSISVPDGQTVFVQEIVNVLAEIVGTRLVPQAGLRVLTVSETQAAEAERARAMTLPDGWEPTLDGVSVTMQAETGARAHSRTYTYMPNPDEEPFVVAAPCDEQGNPVPGTADLLRQHTPCEAEAIGDAK